MKRKSRGPGGRPPSPPPSSGPRHRHGPATQPRTGNRPGRQPEPTRPRRDEQAMRPAGGGRPAPSPRPAPRSTPQPSQSAAPRPGPTEPRRPRSAEEGGAIWLYGVHAALAAIGNPERRIVRIVVAREQMPDLAPRVAALAAQRATGLPDCEPASREEIDRLLPRGAVHQGLAVLASELEPLDIDDLLRLIGDQPRLRLVALDQVTDPHNVGAILRSAAAFGATAVILPERHAPAASAVMAKAASGALEKVPLVRVVNLARALESLKAANVWCVGLAGSAAQTIAQADLTGRVALVLGSEGEGLRRLTRERCDLLVRIDMPGGGVDSLNVSNAAAVALYEAARPRDEAG